MKYTELTNKRADDDCRLEAPDFGCCPRCPPPCRLKCCPRTHVWDAVDVFGDEAAHKFALLALTGGTLQVLPAHLHCIELVITERGWCDVLCSQSERMPRGRFGSIGRRISCVCPQVITRPT